MEWKGIEFSKEKKRHEGDSTYGSRQEEQEAQAMCAQTPLGAAGEHMPTSLSAPRLRAFHFSGRSSKVLRHRWPPE